MKETIIKITCALIILSGTFIVIEHHANLRYIIGLIIGIPALILVIIGRIQIGKAFAVMPEAKGLVKTGLYSKIRHPLYLFIDFFFLGVIIISGISLLLILLLVLFVVQLVQSKREEKVLTNAYGEEYIKYKEQCWF